MRAREIAAAINGRLLGDDHHIAGISSLADATPTDISFLIWPHDVRMAQKSRAGVIVAEISLVADYADVITSPLIAVENLADSFREFKSLIDDDIFVWPKKVIHGRTIHPSNQIHQTALVGEAYIAASVSIEAFAMVGDGASIGEGTVIGAGVKIAPNVKIGKHCQIGANSVIGTEGFVPFGAYLTSMLPCLGSVEILDSVRVGALCTVDRGLLSNTRIGNGCMIDDQVHVGHDVNIGQNVVIAAQSGLAGFVRIEDDVTLGGQIGVKPHVTIGQGARISGKSFVHCDIKSREIWSGNPSVPHALYLRSYGKLKRRMKDADR